MEAEVKRSELLKPKFKVTAVFGGGKTEKLIWKLEVELILLEGMYLLAVQQLFPVATGGSVATKNILFYKVFFPHSPQYKNQHL